MTVAYPFMNAYGKIKDVFEAIIKAGVPARFTQDFLETKLGFKSSSIRPVISILKKIGLIASDGSPTDLYKDFRSDSLRGAALARAIKTAYEGVFDANEYAQDLKKKELEDIFVRLTGAEKGSSTVSAYVGTFQSLCSFANFDSALNGSNEDNDDEPEATNNIQSFPLSVSQKEPSSRKPAAMEGGIGMNLSYTINLNLPETKDVEVFNAIFESLREKLLR